MNPGSKDARLPDPAAEWLAAAVLEIEDNPSSISRYFASASRICGRAPVRVGDLDGLRYGCLDDLARAAMLTALSTSDVDLISRVTDLYRYGDANEKRGVLRGAHELGASVGDALLPLIDDAVRSNDTRLIAAALQRYGAEHLGAQAFRHAVVKCVFVGIPLSAVVALSERRDAELVRMLVDLAYERRAAGRAIPVDILPLVAHIPASLDRPDLPADFIGQLSAFAARDATDTTATTDTAATQE